MHAEALAGRLAGSQASRVAHGVRSLFMSVLVNVNGKISDGASAAISVFDHGFLYGEGVYETMRTYNGEPFLFDRHMKRLRASAGMIMLDVPYSDNECLQRCHGHDERRRPRHARPTTASPRPTSASFTRAASATSPTIPRPRPTPSVVIIVKPVAGHADEQFDGVKVCMVDIIRNHPQSVNPLIKSNNLLNNALCMQQALRKGGVEGVFRNYRGELSECSQSNLFIVKNGVVRTPPLDAGLLAGITRAFVFELGEAIGIKSKKRSSGRRSVRRRRSVLHQHDQGADADRAGGRSHDRRWQAGPGDAATARGVSPPRQ